jgi:hypothetical protein
MRAILALLLPVLLVAQSSLLQIRVVEGEGAAYLPGSRSPGLTVEVTDELGKPVAGAIVSVRLPDDGPGGSFANSLATEIVTTGANGRATTSPVRWNRLTGPVELRVTAVKGRLRAGTVATCQLSEKMAARRAAGPFFEPFAPTGHASGGKGRLKWIVIGIAASALVGVGAAIAGGSHSSGTSPAATTVQIGSPTITVGKP